MECKICGQKLSKDSVHIHIREAKKQQQDASLNRNWIGKKVRHLFNKDIADVVDSRSDGIDIKVEWKNGIVSDWMSFRAFELI